MSENIVAIVVARMKSARLSGKPLAEMNGYPIIQWLVERISRSRYINAITFLLANGENEWPLHDFIDGKLIKDQCKNSVFIGYKPLNEQYNDLTHQLRQAAFYSKADIIVRVTADCPLLCPLLVDHFIETFLDERPDYLSNVMNPFTYPQGQTVEVFSRECIEDADFCAPQYSVRDRAFGTGYIYSIPGCWRYRIKHMIAPPPLFYPQIRDTVDTLDDLKFCQAIVDELELTPYRKHGSAEEIVALCRRKPELLQINANQEQSVLVTQDIIVSGGVPLTDDGYTRAPTWWNEHPELFCSASEVQETESGRTPWEKKGTPFTTA